MSTKFEKKFDCQVKFQYSYNGKKKNYYPIISNLHQSDIEISLDEFSTYPKIDFYSSEFRNVTFSTKRIRDMNFQDSNLQNVEFDIKEFNGTLGFANCSLSLKSLLVKSSPKILAIVESYIECVKEPGLAGFDNLHTLALINSSLDFLELDNLIDQISCDQLLLTDLNHSNSFHFRIPDYLKSVKLRGITLSQFPNASKQNQLERCYLESVKFQSMTEFEIKLMDYQQLKELSFKNIDLKFLADLSLPQLELLQIDHTTVLDEKLIARLKIAGVDLVRI